MLTRKIIIQASFLSLQIDRSEETEKRITKSFEDN